MLRRRHRLHGLDSREDYDKANKSQEDFSHLLYIYPNILRSSHFNEHVSNNFKMEVGEIQNFGDFLFLSSRRNET